MFTVRPPAAFYDDRPAAYRGLIEDCRNVVAGERDPIANLANVSSMLFHALPDVNWAGFYLHRGDQLILGPFQGKPACVRIPVGRGVCGTAARRRVTVVVPDVHAFPGHIACDSASRSEIVVPLLLGSRLLGVMDLDSPILARFDHDDQVGLELIAGLLVAGSDW